MATDVAAVLVAYALGCVQTGYYLVRARTGQDLRQLGSGGTGARNAGRVLGRTAFVLTLLGDLAKGALALAVAAWLRASPGAMAAALVAVTAGHVWPVQLRFSGGRGIAVGLGAMAVQEPRLLAVLAGLALLGYALTRRFQVGGLLGFALLPLAAWWMRLPGVALAGISGMCMIVLFAHRSHIAGWIRPGAQDTRV